MAEDVRKALNRIISHKTDVKEVNEKCTFSAGNRKLNLMRNKNNSIFLKALHQGGESIHAQKAIIRGYIKENNIDIMHLNAFKSAFLDCDEH